MATYSFGKDSPLKFEISDKLAQHYNDAVRQYFKTQTHFSQKFGRTWDTALDPIEINWTRKQQHAWNTFAKIFDKAMVKYDAGQGHYFPSDIMDDYLVKNTVSMVSATSRRWGRVILLSAAAGALYGFFRGR